MISDMLFHNSTFDQLVWLGLEDKLIYYDVSLFIFLYSLLRQRTKDT